MNRGILSGKSRFLCSLTLVVTVQHLVWSDEKVENHWSKCNAQYSTLLAKVAIRLDRFSLRSLHLPALDTLLLLHQALYQQY